LAKPQLYVFAGPNGAGKSTLSADLVPPGTPVFDGDVEFLKLKKFFYDLDDNQIRSSVNDNVFPEWKIEVIRKGKDAAFETNFRSGEVIDSVKQFMTAGYQSRLIFMGLDSVEVSIDRVNLRVAKGGHNVSVFDINNNYEQSLINLSQFYNVFTSVHVYQNFQMPGENIQMTPLMNIKSGKIIEQAAELPEWAKSFYDKITGK
jgi:predicted ABC-type ATPase